MTRMVTSLLLLGTIFMAGCSAIQLAPNAARVIASRNAAPKGCKFLGMVTGSQGGALVGAYTSNKDLAEGAMNDLRNKAASLGGNYVQIEADRAGQTASGSGGGAGWGFGGSYSSAQTDVTLTGNVYNCEPSEIGVH